MTCCDLLDHSSSVWFRRSRSCEPCRSAIVPQDWHKQSPSWAASTRGFMRSPTSTMRPSVVAYSSNSIKAKSVINWLEPYSTESGASCASDIVKDRKISLERLDWL